MKKMFLLSLGLIGLAMMSFKGCPENGNEKFVENKSANDSTVVIASINNGVVAFVADQNVLKSDWQKFITNIVNQGICHLDNVQIITYPNNSKYYLVASGTISGTAMKSSLQLQQDGTCMIVTGYVVTCTSSACSAEVTGCIPNYTNTACEPCHNQGKCTKTVTTDYHGIFPSLSPSTCQD